MKFNFTAPINSLSYGVCGLNILKHAIDMGHEVSYWPIGQIEAPNELHPLIQQSIQNAQTFDYNAPSLRLYHQFDMAHGVGKGMRCGFPIFELNQFTEQEKQNLCSLDKIIVCSQWAKEIVLEQIRKEHPRNCTPDELVNVAPLGVDRNIFNEKLTTVKNSDATVFLNIGKWEVRKGHDILVDAFNQAFTPDDNVLLYMHCPNPFIGENGNKEWEEMYMNSPMGQAGKIQVSNQRLQSQQEIAQLIAMADCGVFLSRAEGWNLELLEMMSMGRQVICTNYSGHTEFCNKHNSLLIEVNELEEAYDGIWFHGQGKWAKLEEKQFEQLIVYMKNVNNNCQFNVEGINTAKRLSWENTTQKVIDALFSF